MRIILVRHGQTEWNLLKKYQGQTDIPLTDVGRNQAQQTGEYLAKNETIEALYCSDLSRAKETAEIVGRTVGLSPVSDPRLREIAFGEWEGLTFTQVYEKYPEEFNDWYNNTFKTKVPGGETFDQVINRSMAAIKEILTKQKGTVAIVTHGGVIKAILSQSEIKSDLWQTTVEPGSITILEFSDVYGEKFVPLEIGLNPSF